MLQQLLTFISANKVDLLAAAYALCVLGTHLPDPVGKVCSYILAGIPRGPRAQ